MKKELASLLCLLLVCAGILLYFYDRFWWPPDNGFFAHVAQRVAEGEVLNKDIRQVHPGYVHFVNAFALKIFGHDFVSLRYPLVAIFFIQACLVFGLIAKRNCLAALVASLSTIILGLVHFLNPDHHWYVLFFTVLLCWLIASWPIGDRVFFWAGFLVMTIFLFRQLTGIFVGMGAVSYFLLAQSHRKVGRGSLARALLVFFVLCLIIYEAKASHWVGWVTFGLWPVVILLWMVKNLHVDDRHTVRLLVQLGKGALVGVLPMVGYHLMHGSLGAWLDQTWGRAFFMSGKEYLEWKSYGSFIAGGFNAVVSAQNFAVTANGVYWLVLFVLPVVNALLCLIYLAKIREEQPLSAWAVFPLMAVFYGLVSIHYQIPVYLYFSIGFVTMSILMWGGIMPLPRYFERALLVVIVLLYAVSLRYQAAQPLRRSFADFFSGNTVTLVEARGILPATDLKIDPYDLDAYQRLLKVIEDNSKAGEYIFAFPYNPEIYFMSGRKNPMPFALTDHGIQNPEDLQAVLQRLHEEPPVMVISSSSDKRQDRYTLKLKEYVQRHYDIIETVNFWEIYRRRGLQP